MARIRCNRSGLPKIYNQSVFPSLAEREISLGNRLQGPQLFHRKERSEIRSSGLPSHLSSPQRLCHQHRYQRCFPSHSHSPFLPLSPSIRCRRPSLRIPYPPLRRQLRSSYLVKSPRRRHQAPSLPQRTHIGIYGRYANREFRRSHLHPSHRSRHPSLRKSGPYHQLRKVCPSPYSKNSTYRFPVRHPIKQDHPSHRQAPRHHPLRQSPRIRPKSYTKEDCQDDRKANQQCPSSPPSDLQEKTSHVRPSPSTEASQPMGRTSSSLPHLPKISDVLLLSSSSSEVQLSSSDPGCRSLDSDDRRLSLGMGRHPRRRLSRSPALLQHQRHLLARRTKSILQLQRDSCSITSHPLLQGYTLTHKKTNPLQNGQLHRSVLHKADGRSHAASRISDRPINPFFAQASHPPLSRASSRKREPYSRRSQPIPKERPRLPAFKHVFSKNRLPSTFDRSIRLSSERTNPPFLQLVSRPTSYLSRRLLPQLEQRKALRLSADPSNQESLVLLPSPSFPMLPDTGNPFLAESHLVAIDAQSPFQSSYRDSPSNDHIPTESFLCEASSASHLRHSPAEQSILSRAISFIESNTSSAVLKNRSRFSSNFSSYCEQLGIIESDISLIGFILDEIVPSVSCFQSIQSVLSNIDAERYKLLQPPLQVSSLVKQFKKALKKRFPASSKSSHCPPSSIPTLLRSVENIPTYSPPPPSVTLHLTDTPSLILSEPSLRFLLQSQIQSTRLRALILIRLCALLRSIDCASIRRNSIVRSKDALNRDIVIFFYRGKAASIHNVTEESNYVEFLPNNPLICPASAILALKDLVDKLDPPHNSLFCYERFPFHPLTSQGVSSIMRRHLKFLDLKIKPHDIREISADFLRLKGVPSIDRDLRGGWKPKNCSDSETQRLHYNSRLSSFNFAEVLSSALQFIITEISV